MVELARAGRTPEELSREFEPTGKRISDFDLAIAVHAVAYGLTLVTEGRAFERLQLPRENWLARQG